MQNFSKYFSNKECVYVTIGNPAFCLFLNLTGVHFQGELQHSGDVSQQKIKCRSTRTREIGGVSLSNVLYVKCRGDFGIFWFALAMRRQKKLPKTQKKPFYITSAMASVYLDILTRTRFGFLTVEATWVIPKLFCLLVTHLNEWIGRQYFSLRSRYFGFFLCPCSSRRT